MPFIIAKGILPNICRNLAGFLYFMVNKEMKEVEFMILGIITFGIILIIFIIRNKYSSKNNLREANIPKGYSVFITDSFSEKDYEDMLPIFTLIFIQNGVQGEVVLCRALDSNGELTLKEAEELMIRNITFASENHSFVKTMIYDESLITDGEKHVGDALNKLV